MGLLDYLFSGQQTNPLLDQSGADAVGNPMLVDPSDAAEGKRRFLQALATMPSVQAAKDAVTAPVDAYQGKFDPTSDEGIARAMGMAGLAMTGGVAGTLAGGVPREAVGIFGGRLAKTADHAALAQAEEMAAQGAPHNDIWQQTGWFKGADDKWRFEIPDQNARLTLRARGNLNSGVDQKLGGLGVLDHPELFAAYPELRDVTLHGRVYGDNLGTSYGGNVALKPGMPPHHTMDTLIHELQHEVQNTEGFAKGGQPGLFEMSPEALNSTRQVVNDYGAARALQREVEAGTAKSVEQAAKLHRDLGMDVSGEAVYYARETPPHLLETFIRDNTERLDRAKNSGYEGYRRLAGEAEAREAERRREFSGPDRRDIPPYGHPDAVPQAQQILRNVR